MFAFMLGIVAEHRSMQNYEVFCNRCDDSIGVMSVTTIRSAIWNTLERGGVLCPACRKKTCDGCGTVAVSGNYRVAEGQKGWARLCFGCIEFNNIINERITNEHLWEAVKDSQDAKQENGVGVERAGW